MAVLGEALPPALLQAPSLYWNLTEAQACNAKSEAQVLHLHQWCRNPGYLATRVSCLRQVHCRMAAERIDDTLFLFCF